MKTKPTYLFLNKVIGNQNGSGTFAPPYIIIEYAPDFIIKQTISIIDRLAKTKKTVQNWTKKEKINYLDLLT